MKNYDLKKKKKPHHTCEVRDEASIYNGFVHGL